MKSRKEMWNKKREWDLDERSWEVPMSFFLIFHFVTLIAHFVSLFFFSIHGIDKDFYNSAWFGGSFLICILLVWGEFCYLFVCINLLVFLCFWMI